MAYTALSPRVPRIVLAPWKDLFHWQRLGPATFAPGNGISLDRVDEKDASLFPVAISNPSGLAWRASTIRSTCRREESPTSRKQSHDTESNSAMQVTIVLSALCASS